MKTSIIRKKRKNLIERHKNKEFKKSVNYYN